MWALNINQTHLTRCCTWAPLLIKHTGRCGGARLRWRALLLVNRRAGASAAPPDWRVGVSPRYAPMRMCGRVPLDTTDVWACPPRHRGSAPCVKRERRAREAGIRRSHVGEWVSGSPGVPGPRWRRGEPGTQPAGRQQGDRGAGGAVGRRGERQSGGFNSARCGHRVQMSGRWSLVYFPSWVAVSLLVLL